MKLPFVMRSTLEAVLDENDMLRHAVADLADMVVALHKTARNDIRDPKTGRFVSVNPQKKKRSK